MVRHAVLFNQDDLFVIGHRQDAYGITIILTQYIPFKMAYLSAAQAYTVNIEIVCGKDFLAFFFTYGGNPPWVEFTVCFFCHITHFLVRMLSIIPILAVVKR